MRLFFSILLVVVLTTDVAGVASARPEAHAVTKWVGVRALRSNVSRSLGYPWHGSLLHGVQLKQSSYIRYAGEYTRSTNFFGTRELVQLVERAAKRVARRLPGAKLSVGELSRKSGGEIHGHSSHENGRDVDLAFYMKNGKGVPFEPYGFAGFGPDGSGVGVNRGLRFDDARNWELVSRLITDGDARVQYVFVSKTIRQRLLKTAHTRFAPSPVIARASRVLVQPAEGHAHQNHFHVRIYCAPKDLPHCKDRAPYHPWHWKGRSVKAAPLSFLLRLLQFDRGRA